MKNKYPTGGKPKDNFLSRIMRARGTCVPLLESCETLLKKVFHRLEDLLLLARWMIPDYLLVAPA